MDTSIKADRHLINVMKGMYKNGIVTTAVPHKELKHIYRYFPYTQSILFAGSKCIGLFCEESSSFSSLGANSFTDAIPLSDPHG